MRDGAIEFAKITNQSVSLGGKEVKEGALGDARLGDDLIDADRVETGLLEKRKRRVTDPLPQIFAGYFPVRALCRSSARDHGHDCSHELRHWQASFALALLIAFAVMLALSRLRR